MENTRYRSLFWPIILIAVGVVWTLSNLNVIPNFQPLALLNLWPLLLIALGLDLIFGRKSPVVGLLIGVVTVGLALVLVVSLPNLGFGMGVNDPGKTYHFTEPLGEATSANVEIDSASEPVRIKALDNSSNLFDGTLQSTGTVNFQVSGSTQKQIRLSSSSNFGPFFFFGFSGLDTRWDLGLSAQVPLNLKYNGGSGPVELDLTKLKLTGLQMDGGSGSFNVNLPVSSQPYTVTYDGGSGSLNLSVAADSDITLRLSGGSGSINLRLPANSATRLEVKDNGSGSISTGGLNRISGKANDDQGVWESAGYASAAHKLLIVVEDLGSGSISLR